jgi:mannose-6-phosphate isomerase-like protein (cupin superfamily)
MKTNLILFILILFIYLIFNIYYINQNDNIKDKIYNKWTNINFNFDINDFKNKCGKEIVEIGDFSNNGKSNLYPIKTSKIKFLDWFDEKNINVSVGNKQTRIFFNKNTKNPITLYILNWLYKIKHKLPIKLQKILDNNDNKIKFAFRISRGKWDYPSHYDAVNSYMFVISGNRHVIVNNNKKFLLKPNTIFFFGQGVYHHFWCDSVNDLNIAICINYINKKNDNTISDKFSEDYPQQIIRLNNHLDYIDSE